MPEINWILTPKQLEYIWDKTRKLSIEGSAGSGKTIMAITLLIKYALEHPNARCYVFRQFLPDLKRSVLEDIRDMLFDYDIPYNENKSENHITFPNRSKIFFSGLDEPKKIRSINADFIYVEQAEEISLDSYRELIQRLRGKASVKDYGQLILVVTPETKSHWIYKEFHLNKTDDMKVIHFSYKDNPFLPPEKLSEYEELRDRDYDAYVKYTLGKWNNLTNMIYTNYDNKMRANGYEFYSGGCDFGFNNPSCFLLIGWYDNEPYIIDEVYESGLTNPEFIKKVDEKLAEYGLVPKSLHTLYCDSAEPDRIAEFAQAGYNAVGADKNVKAGIGVVKSVKLHIAEKCVNTNREIGGYRYRKDRNGIILDEPMKTDDHAMDAIRYGVYPQLSSIGFNKKEIAQGIRIY